MQPTRRTLFIAGASAALLSLSRFANATEAFLWQHFGAAPYALSRAEAMRMRESAFRSLGLPRPVVAAFMRATDQPGSHVDLTNGDRLTKMLSKGGVVHRNVTVDFVKPPISGEMEYAAPAEMWQVRWQGKVYTLILPAVCGNWSLIIERSAHAGCYLIPLDYRQTPGVEWKKGVARIEFHFVGMTERKLERLNGSPCFGVRDATGFHTPFHRCDVCDTGEWPPPALAKAVGLPKVEPRGVFTSSVEEGVGYVSLPRWATAYLGIYCVDVHGYAISVSGFRTWEAVSRFDLVLPAEMQRTLPVGRLDRTLAGKGHY